MSGAVLVTGATGVVGSALLPRLAGHEVLCLQHRATVARPGVEVIAGDIRRPRFGLGDAAYAALAERVGVVVHSAAITDFTEAREAVFAVNVDGTAHALQLAADAGARHLQVSTAFVTVHNETESGWVSARHYLDSKRAAEELVSAAAADTHVIRPSVVIGDSATGATARLQGYHQMTKSVFREGMPIFVVDEDTRFDFVPSDLVADVLAAAVQAPPPGRESWVTTGEDAWLVSDVLDVLVDVAAQAGRPVAPPRLIGSDMYERLVKPVFLEELPKRTRRRFEKVQALTPTILVPHTLPSSLTALGEHYGRPFAFDAEATLRASARFLLGQTPAPVGT
jgi:nucleoside-diphosphate-sugar epimerase